MSRRVARDSLLSALASLATILAGAASTVIVARTLGVEGTGIVTIALWIATLAVTVAGLGLPTAVTRFVAERGSERARTAIARRFLWPTLGAALVLLASAAVAASLARSGWAAFAWDAPGLDAPDAQALVWAVLGVSAAAQVLGQYRLGVLRGRGDFRSVATTALVGLALQLAGTWAGALTFGVTGALAGYALGALPPALACLVIRGSASRPPAGTVPRVRRFALYAWAGAILSAFVWARIEIYFLQRYEGFEAVGYFTAGLTLASLAAQGPLLLTGALLPHFARAYAGGEMARVRADYASATRLIAFLSFPAGLGLAALMPAAVPLVFGEAFRPAIPVASLLVAAAAVGAASSVGTHLVNALERSDFVFHSSLCGAVLAVTAGFTLVPAFGLMGAGGARVLIQAAMVAAGQWFISRRLGCPAPWRDLGLLLLSAGLAALAARACLHAIPGPAAMLVAIPAAVLVYAGAVRATGALPAEDRERLRRTLALLPGPLPVFGRPVLLLIRAPAPSPGGGA